MVDRRGDGLVDFLCGRGGIQGTLCGESVTLESYVAARTYRGRAALIADRVVHRLKALRAKSQRMTMRRLLGQRRHTRPRTTPGLECPRRRLALTGRPDITPQRASADLVRLCQRLHRIDQPGADIGPDRADVLGADAEDVTQSPT